MKRLVLVLMACGLLGAMPILAAENCDMKIDAEEGVSQCDLKTVSVRNKIERIEGEINEGEINKGSKEYTTEELKKMEENAKEDNAILEELSKRVESKPKIESGPKRCYFQNFGGPLS